MIRAPANAMAPSGTSVLTVNDVDAFDFRFVALPQVLPEEGERPRQVAREELRAHRPVDVRLSPDQ